MQWLELTSQQMPEAIERSGGLCVVPMGCIERHGAHLPLGTDQIVADEVARRAAGIEPAVVFPPYYLSKIFTARHYAGTFALTRRLLLGVLEATVDEIARNGFKKILIANGHGGNTNMLRFFVRTLLDEPRDYVVYAADFYVLDTAAARRWEQMRETDHGDHADEAETSVMLHLRPDLVHMEDLTPPSDGEPRGIQKGLEGLQNPLSWYADHPTHYAGDARPASAEKGEFLLGAYVDKLVGQMRAVKADDATAELLRKFYASSRNPG